MKIYIVENPTLPTAPRHSIWSTREKAEHALLLVNTQGKAQYCISEEEVDPLLETPAAPIAPVPTYQPKWPLDIVLPNSNE